MRKLFYRPLFLILALALIIGGCSDNSTNSDIDTEAMSESLKAQTTMMVNSLGYIIGYGFDYLNEGVGPYAKPADTSYFDFDDQTYWHTYYEDASITEPYVRTFSELDSIRFSAGDVHQEDPDETTNGLEFRLIGEELMQYAADSSIALEVRLSCDYSLGDVDTVTIDGRLSYAMEMVLSTLEMGYDYDCEFGDIIYVYETYNHHPVSGSLTLDIGLHSSGDPAQEIPAGDFSASMTLTFDEDGYSGDLTIEGDNYTWEVSWNTVANSPGYGLH
jgi:hypothetical protein